MTQTMDAFAALCLQLEWGADDALELHPVDRRQEAAPIIPLKNGSPKTANLPAFVPPPIMAASRAQELADQAHTVEALRETVATFEHCALRTTASHTVFFAGNPESKLILIADTPDADDDRAGQPFAGPPGELLDKILQSVGLARADVLIAYLVPWRPPGNRPLTKQELDICAPFLKRLLQLVKPERAMLLGGLPAKAIFETEETLRRLRGKWRDVGISAGQPPIKALATHHPATLIATPACKREAWMDWLALRESIDNAA